MDMDMSCPFTGKLIYTTFLDKNMYPFYVDKGYGYMFEEETDDNIDNSINNDNKTENEIQPE